MSDEHVTQRLALTIRNKLSAGNITIMNLICLSGQPYQERDTLQIISPKDVNHMSIRPGGSDVMSFCGSAAFKLGIEGMLDLCLDQETPIASIYWHGPWDRSGNQFHAHNINSERYRVVVSVPSDEGVLGDLSIEISDAG